LPDCLHSTVSIESVENGAILYQEKWRSRESLDGHLRSGTYTRVLEALELSCRNPEVTVFDRLEVGGLEIIEMSRNHSVEDE
jgi:quinol monooxygenase YgiN